MKTPSERGVIGAWAFAARGEAGLSVEQVAERVSELGQSVTASTIRGIESGNKKPGARLLRLMAKVLESTPPGETPAPSEAPDLATALASLATATRAMADELGALRAERSALASRVEDLEGQVDQLVRAGRVGRDSAEPRAPASPGQ